MPVFVHAPVPPEAHSAFELAAGQDQRVGGVVEDETAGELEVCFELAPGDVDRAFNEARSRYARIAHAAGVPVPDPLEMRMSGFETLVEQPSRARVRLSHAHELHAREEHALAVVVAQTSCDTAAEAAESLATAEALIDYVEQATGTAAPPAG